MLCCCCLGTQLTLEQQVERAIVAAQALAPKLPNYMNPGAMNPLKFQSIQEKRKLLWGSKKKVGMNCWQPNAFPYSNLSPMYESG